MLLLDLKIAISKCSIDTYSSFIFLAIIAASFSVFVAVEDIIILPPDTLEKLSNCLSKILFNKAIFIFSLFNINGITFLSTSKIAFKICSFSIN